MANFPTSLPSFTLTSGSETLNGAAGGLGISGLLNSFEGEIVALGTKLGTGSSTPVNNTFLIGNGTGTSTWSALTSVQLAARISDETGSGALVFATSPTLVSPIITTPPTNVSRLSGEIVAYAGRTAPTDWLMCDGSTVSRATFSTLFGILAPTIGTFTVTIATPAVVTLNGHAFVTGDAVYLTTTGALPTNLVANTLYYVVRINANTFNLATSRANAYSATKINTTGSQSGTHTCLACPYGLGDGSTTFNVPDLRGSVVAGADAMSGTAASKLTLAQTQGIYGNQGASGGEQGHQIVTAELASHTHGAHRYLSPDFNNGTASASGAATWGAETIPSAGSDTAHNNIQPTVVANYIIKT